jgi:hypothetical protein
VTIVVVIPSRGRPERARAAVEAVRQTAELMTTSVILAVDRDDPHLQHYLDLRWPNEYRAETWISVLERESTGNLVKATNTVSMRVVEDDPDAIVGNLGDDHVCRTPGWDKRIEETLRTPGIAYGDDLLQGELLPTAPFISGAIVRALGWFALPCCKHMYIDDAWKALGLATDTLRYVPDVVIEHEHPATGKVPWDEGYVRVNNQAALDADLEQFHRWRNTTFYDDVVNIRRALR